MATTKNEMLDALLQRMDDALANGKRLPWQKPWEPKFGDLSAPHNPTTERLYSPLNGLILSTAALEHGYEDPRWMGYNQAKEQGWSVRRGEHAAARIFSPIVKKEIDPKTGLEEPRVVAYRGTPLFNAAQIDGIPPMREIPEHERLPKTVELDAIAHQMGVAILHSGSGAFYSPGQDRIQLPQRDTFVDQHGYDATKAHELSHATGHESRLDRDSLRQYTSIKGRAAEEMTAEIGAYLLSTRLGVPFMGNNPDMTDAQHAAYLTTWAKDLSPDERRIAIEQGIKAAGHLEKQLELARENGLVPELGKQASEREVMSRDRETTPDTNKAAMQPDKRGEQAIARTSQALHKITITHRTDLKVHVYPVSIPDKPDMEMRNHPRQEISGVLKDFSKSEFLLETPEFGAVRVETGKNMFMGREEELRAAVGKPVDIALDKTGKELSLAVHHGLAGGSQGVSVLFDQFVTPGRPFGLMSAVDMGKTTAKPVTGKLTHVHDSSLIELRSAGKSVLVHGPEPDKAHQAEIRKMIGKQVRVSADLNTGQLSVKTIQPTRKQDIGLER